MSTQGQLTENLWFLSKLLPPNPRDPNAYESVEHESTLAVLDAVSIYLTTGQSDGAIACHYQDLPATLILAKGGRVNSEDRSAVASLLKELAAAKSWLDLIPFIAQRSPDKVNKRIRKLRTCFLRCFDDMCRDIRTYEPDPDSSMPEFRGRWSRVFLKRNGLDQTATTEIRQTLAQVLNLCKDYLMGNQEFGNTPPALADFIRLLYATKTLLDSQFFETYNYVTLKQRLAKVTQYLDIHYAIKFLRGLGGTINVEWVTDVGYGTAKCILDTTAVGERFKKSCVSYASQDTKDIMLWIMDSKFSGWRGDKEGSIQVTLFVHPEIRLFLDLVRRNLVQNSDVVIGCSQKRCYACKLWIEGLRSEAEMGLVTTFDSGKPRFDWFVESD